MAYNTHRRFSKEEQLLIVNDYFLYKSCYKLAKKYNTYAQTIFKILKRNNVTLEKPGGRKNLQIKDYQFDKIDTEEKAYWLGFIAADGCVSLSGRNRSFYVRLAIKDKDQLEKLAEFINFDKSKIKIIEKDNRLYCVISLTNKDLVLKLIDLGIVPLKSYNLEWITKVPKNLIRHFIRGYFDGDGCWSFYKIKPMFEVVGTDKFTEGLQNFLVDNLKLNKTKKYATGKNKIAQCVKYCGYNNSKKIYEFLYQDSNISMFRKKEKIEKLLLANQERWPQKYYKNDFVEITKNIIGELECFRPTV